LDDGSIKDVPLRIAARVQNGISVLGKGALATRSNVKGGVTVENHKFVKGIAVYDQPAAAAGYIEPVPREIQGVVSWKGKVQVNVDVHKWNDTWGIATTAQRQTGQQEKGPDFAHVLGFGTQS
jgi:hypothetical protein